MATEKIQSFIIQREMVKAQYWPLRLYDGHFELQISISIVNITKIGEIREDALTTAEISRRTTR